MREARIGGAGAIETHDTRKPTTSVVRRLTARPRRVAPPTRHSERAPGAQRLKRVEESPVHNAQAAPA